VTDGRHATIQPTLDLEDYVADVRARGTGVHVCEDHVLEGRKYGRIEAYGSDTGVGVVCSVCPTGGCLIQGCRSVTDG
jgi:hypothetical protein